MVEMLASVPDIMDYKWASCSGSETMCAFS